MFVPWIALLASQLGPAAGGVSGAASTACSTSRLPKRTDARRPPGVPAAFPAARRPRRCRRLSSRRISSDARELQSTDARQRALLDSTLDGICLTDPAGQLRPRERAPASYALDLGLPLDGTVAERLLSLADRTTEPARYRRRMLELARTSPRARTSSSSPTAGGCSAATPHRSRGGRKPGRADLDAARGDGRPQPRAPARRVRRRGLPRAAHTAHLDLGLPRAAQRRGTCLRSGGRTLPDVSRRGTRACSASSRISSSWRRSRPICSSLHGARPISRSSSADTVEDARPTAAEQRDRAHSRRADSPPTRGRRRAAPPDARQPPL